MTDITNFTCFYCDRPIPIWDECILGELAFHQSCADDWRELNPPPYKAPPCSEFED